MVILGGYKDEYVGDDSNAWVSSKIAKFDGATWTDLGELQSARMAHSVVNFHGHIMIIGGDRGFESQETT